MTKKNNSQKSEASEVANNSQQKSEETTKANIKEKVNKTSETSKSSSADKSTAKAERKTSTAKPQDTLEKTAEQLKEQPKEQQKNKSKTSEQNRGQNSPEKPHNNQSPPKKTEHNNHSHSKKSGGFLGGIALFLGLVGTVLAAYALNEVRAVKTNDSGELVTTKISEFTEQLDNKNSDSFKSIEKQLNDLGSTQKEATANLQRFNERVSQVEQMQEGLRKTTQTDVGALLDEHMKEVDKLLKKVNEIELSQKGLAKNIDQSTAANLLASESGLNRQEASYLLRMANYKLQSEEDVIGAIGLLKIAEDRLMLANGGQSDGVVDLIRQKLIQLQGVKPVDTNAILRELKQLSRIVSELSVKIDNPTVSEPQATESPESGSIINKIGTVLASGVKYTPKDPNKINISAETILIEKRLIQADVKTAELAVRSHNQVLLAESIHSIRESLEKYFATDEVANTVQSILKSIEKSKLETVLPDLSSVITAFDNSQ